MHLRLMWEMSRPGDGGEAGPAYGGVHDPHGPHGGADAHGAACLRRGASGVTGRARRRRGDRASPREGRRRGSRDRLVERAILAAVRRAPAPCSFEVMRQPTATPWPSPGWPATRRAGRRSLGLAVEEVKTSMPRALRAAALQAACELSRGDGQQRRRPRRDCGSAASRERAGRASSPWPRWITSCSAISRLRSPPRAAQAPRARARSARRAGRGRALALPARVLAGEPAGHRRGDARLAAAAASTASISSAGAMSFSR